MESASAPSPGVMTVWVRYTASTLARLRDELSPLAGIEHRCYVDVVDDDVADLVYDVRNEAEGAEVVAALEERLRRVDGVDVVSATFFRRGYVD